MGRLLFSVTKKCNANCIFCEIPFKEKLNPHPKLNELIENFKKRVRKSHKEVALTGGEPGIYPQIFELIDFIKKNYPQFKTILLESNGLIYSSKKLLEKFIRHGVNRFQMSFQHIDPQLYEKIINVPNPLPIIKKSLSNLKEIYFKYNIEYDINLVVHKLNYVYLKEIIKFLLNYNPKTIIITFYNPVNTTFVDEKGLSITRIRYSEVMPYIRETFNSLSNQEKNRIKLNYFPLCIIEELGKYSLEYNYPKQILNNTAYEIDYENQKCKKCKKFDTCFGILILKIFPQVTMFRLIT